MNNVPIINCNYINNVYVEKKSFFFFSISRLIVFSIIIIRQDSGPSTNGQSEILYAVYMRNIIIDESIVNIVCMSYKLYNAYNIMIL